MQTNAEEAIPDATSVSYSDGVLTVASGTPKLAKPSVLEGLEIYGIEQWGGKSSSSGNSQVGSDSGGDGSFG